MSTKAHFVQVIAAHYIVFCWLYCYKTLLCYSLSWNPEQNCGQSVGMPGLSKPEDLCIWSSSSTQSRLGFKNMASILC